MYITMLRESHGGQVDQQGHPNEEGGLMLIGSKSSSSPPR